MNERLNVQRHFHFAAAAAATATPTNTAVPQLAPLVAPSYFVSICSPSFTSFFFFIFTYLLHCTDEVLLACF
jgi:hypothetical protein